MAKKLPLSPFEKILKESSKLRVSDSATREFVDVIEEIARDLAQDAAELAKHAGRRTVLKEDIKLARKRKL